MTSKRMKAKKNLYAETILQHMPVGAALYDAQYWRLLAANPRFLSYLDTFVEPCWQQGRAIGQCITELNIQAQSSSVIDIFRAVSQSGQAQQIEAMAVFTPQGTLTYWNWTLDALCDEDGTIQYLLQTAIDVTAQVQCQHTTEQSRLSSVLDQLPEGVLMADAITGIITYANPVAAQLLDVAREQLVGMPASQLPQNGKLSQSKQDSAFIPWNFFLIQALSGETIHGKETTIFHEDNTRSVILISGAPLYMNTGIMSGAVLIFQDITEQKSLEQQKNEFLWMANHELRTPVTIIQGFADLLSQPGQQLNDVTHAALVNIVEQSEHLARLIEAMLDMSRIEQEQFKLQLAPENLLALLTHVVESQAITTTRHQIQLVIEGIEPTATLISMLDRAHIIQVLSNLINNAIKYSPQGGTIEVGLRAITETRRVNTFSTVNSITTDKAYREVLIWVKDQGVGIAPNDIPHIFNRFYRSNSLDHSLSGFGIGLYIVKEVVTRHGGRVWVESMRGRGSTFYLWLPLKTPVNAEYTI